MSLRPNLLLPLALLAALSACSAGNAPEDDGAEQEQALTAAQQAADSAATPPPNGTVDAAPPLECDATPVQGLVGQTLEEATAEQARVDTGAKSVRVLEPGQMVTMEFDGERLNIEVDAARKIIALRCG